MLKHLLKNKFRMLLNYFRMADRNKKVRLLLMVIVWGMFIRYLFPGLRALFAAIISNPDFGEIVAVKILAVALFGLFITLLLGGTTICIHTLFISQDLPLLLSVPISRRSLFIYKIIEATFSNSSIFLMLGLPAIAAFGAAMHAKAMYYIIMVILASVFLFIPTTFAGMLSMLVVWIFPVKRAREVMSVLLALIFIAIWAGMQFLRSSFTGDPGSFDPQELAQLSNLAHQPIFLYLPSGWLAKSLLALANSNWASFFVGLLVLLIFTVGMLTVSISLVENVYYRGLAGGEAFATLKGKKKTVTTRARGKNKQYSLILNLFLKDFRLLSRDLPQFMQFFMFAIMMVVMALLFRRDMDSIDTSFVKSFVAYIFIWFFSAMSTVGLSTRLIPLEGKTFYLVKIIPQPFTKTILAKMLLSWVLGSIVAGIGVAVVTIIFKYHLFQFIIAFIFSAIVCFGISGIGVTIGAFYANYDWDNPKRMITTGGGLLSGIIPMVFLVLLLVVAIAIISIVSFLGYSEIIGVLAAIIIIIIINLIFAQLCLKLASQKIKKLAWHY